MKKVISLLLALSMLVCMGHSCYGGSDLHAGYLHGDRRRFRRRRHGDRDGG